MESHCPTLVQECNDTHATPLSEVVARVSQDHYTHVHNDLLFTHTGDDRGLSGPEHDLAQETVFDFFAYVGLNTSLEAFSYGGTEYYNVVGVKPGWLDLAVDRVLQQWSPDPWEDRSDRGLGFRISGREPPRPASRTRREPTALRRGESLANVVSGGPIVEPRHDAHRLRTAPITAILRLAAPGPPRSATKKKPA